MHFSVGQTLVHPHHGPASVHAVANRSINGMELPYLLLKVHGTDLTLGVPVQNIDLVGLREVFTGARLAELIDVLRAPTGTEEPQWSRRMKNHEEKLASGDLFRVAEVVRDLTRRRERHGLSQTEALLLRRSSRPLSTELTLAMELTPEDAWQYLDSLCRIDVWPA